MLQKSVLLFISGVLISFSIDAKTTYVTDSLKLKLRVAASPQAEVITNLTSGEKLTLLEKQKKFSLVRTESGQTGWVLSWFLIDKQPASYIVDSVTKDNQVLSQKLAAANHKLENFDSEARRENEALKTTVASLSEKIKSMGMTQNQLQKKLDAQADKLAKYVFIEKYNIRLIALLFLIFTFFAGFLCARLWINSQERKRLWGYQLAY